MSDVTFRQVEAVVQDFLRTAATRLKMDSISADAIVGHVIIELKLPETAEYEEMLRDTLDIMAGDGKLDKIRKPLGLCYRLV